MSQTLFHVPAFRSSRVLWLYYELQAVHEQLPALTLHTFSDVATFRRAKPAWFLKLNPNGKVPTWLEKDEDDNATLVLFESGAINAHLLRKHDASGALHRRDNLNWMARYDTLAFFTTGTADNVLATSSPIQRVLKDPTPGADADVQATNKLAWHQLVAPVFVDALGDGPYMLGSESFSAADVIVGFNLAAAARKHPQWLAAQPVLQQYFERRILPRDAFRRALDVDNWAPPDQQFK